MSLLDRTNWDRQEQWYTNGTRIAWYDRRIRSWTSYLIDSNKYQRTAAQYYANRGQFEACEDQGHFDDDRETLQEAINNESYG